MGMLLVVQFRGDGSRNRLEASPCRVRRCVPEEARQRPGMTSCALKEVSCFEIDLDRTSMVHRSAPSRRRAIESRRQLFAISRRPQSVLHTRGIAQHLQQLAFRATSASRSARSAVVGRKRECHRPISTPGVRELMTGALPNGCLLVFDWVPPPPSAAKTSTSVCRRSIYPRRSKRNTLSSRARQRWPSTSSAPLSPLPRRLLRHDLVPTAVAVVAT